MIRKGCKCCRSEDGPGQECQVTCCEEEQGCASDSAPPEQVDLLVEGDQVLVRGQRWKGRSKKFRHKHTNNIENSGVTYSVSLFR